MTTKASRREFLKRASLLSIAGAASPFALNLASIGAATAQSADDYKALVCLFMFGGNDHTNTLVPYDMTSYTEYSNARSTIAHPRDSLTPTALGAVAAQGGREFALHPALVGVKDLYAQGKLAMVANVGPLVVPTTKAQYQARSVPLPPKLFSHNDQQSVWQAYAPIGEGAKLGSGGTLGDLFESQNAQSMFTCVSVAGTAVWLSGQNVIQYQVGTNGAVAINALSGSLYGSQSATMGYRRLITRASSHLFEDELAKIMTRSIDANERLRNALPPASTFTVPQGNSLASQLAVVARMIDARQTLGMKRQIFFVSTGGFDNHDNLLTQHNLRMQTLNGALTAFYGYLAQMGVENNVALFTASDFGRTLTSNGDGSDHGWGSHHFVLGGAVQGGTIYGDFPPTRFGSSQDVGNGNLLPTTSVDQYIATFARWFGVPDGNLNLVVPNIMNFPTGTLRIFG